jgi:hypothetical protein
MVLVPVPRFGLLSTFIPSMTAEAVPTWLPLCPI